MLILLGLYWTGLAVYRISHLISFELYTQLVFALVNPVALILFLIFFVGLLEARGLKSGTLQFLGKYSFEVYLLHFPFMVYYDFFIFRRPLVFFFFVYAIFVLLLSVLLQRASVCLDGFIFRKIYAHEHQWVKKRLMLVWNRKERSGVKWRHAFILIVIIYGYLLQFLND